MAVLYLSENCHVQNCNEWEMVGFHGGFVLVLRLCDITCRVIVCDVITSRRGIKLSLSSMP